MGMKFCFSTNTLPPYPEGSVGHTAASRDCSVICNAVVNRNDSLDERRGIKTPEAFTTSQTRKLTLVEQPLCASQYWAAVQSWAS